MTPRVSILMPVYNGLPYLREAVQSVLAQTFTDWEFVIVNDGSKDGTQAYLDEVADERFVVIRQANAGIAAAVNAGLQKCRGEYVARLDADDVALPTRLAEQTAFLDAHAAVAMVGTQVAPLGARGSGGSLLLPTAHDQIMSALRVGKHAVAHSSIMVRSAALREIGGYWQHPFGEEYDLMLRLGEVRQLANLDRILLHYRVHAGSMNGSAMRRMRTSVAYACELARRRQSGEAPVTIEEFAAARAARPWWRKWAEAVDIYAREQYRVALAEIYGGRPRRGVLRMAWAAACQPRLTLERLTRIVAHRLGGRNASRGEALPR